MSHREEFCRLALLPGANVQGLCRRFGIGSARGCKWLSRHRALGVAGLRDRSRRPRTSPGRSGPGAGARSGGCWRSRFWPGGASATSPRRRRPLRPGARSTTRAGGTVRDSACACPKAAARRAGRRECPRPSHRPPTSRRRSCARSPTAAGSAGETSSSDAPKTLAGKHGAPPTPAPAPAPTASSTCAVATISWPGDLRQNIAEPLHHVPKHPPAMSPVQTPTRGKG